jgi:outer membrane protein assembly factor BamB
MAVMGGFVYTCGGRGEEESLYCLRADTGRTVWRVKLPDEKGFSRNGPQSTPTVEGNRLYSFTPGGCVFCVNAENGAIIWKRDRVSDLELDIPLWLFAGSVRIHNGLAIVNAGGGGVALDKNTGRIVWENAEGSCGYATPVIFSSEAGECVALTTIQGLVIAKADSGKILWSYPWSAFLHDYQADPLIIGKRAFISSAYQQGAALVDFSHWKSTVIWENRRLISNLASYVYFDGLIYGNNNPSYNPGDLGAEFFCMEAATGKKLWSKPAELGTVIAVDEYVIRLDQFGNVIIGLRSLKDFIAAAELKALSGTFLTPPAFSGGRLYCRNSGGKIVCIDLRARSP